MAPPGCADASGRCRPRGPRRPGRWPRTGSSDRARSRRATRAGCASGTPRPRGRRRSARCRSTRSVPRPVRARPSRPSSPARSASPRRLVTQPGKEPLERLAQLLDVLLARGSRPLPLHLAARLLRHGPHLAPALGEEHEARAPVVGVGLSLQVAELLELLHLLSHRLLAHVRELRQLAHLDPLLRHERDHVGVCRAEAVEAGLLERFVHVVAPVLVEEPQKEAEHRFRHIDRYLTTLLNWSGACPY